MMAPFVYEEARTEAPMHVQIWRPWLHSPHNETRIGRIDGRVVRIFRDRGRQLRWGQSVSFPVSIIDRKAQSPPTMSGEIYHDWERIGPARFLEAFLEAWNGKIELVYSQIAPIRYPTLHPVCGPDQKGFVCLGNL
ncbi:MAG: hypothetical protein JSR91_10925 [Proteobacteria bacterium]|nr:hypothetical protein [Pseudomonadota bacterium]